MSRRPPLLPVEYDSDFPSQFTYYYADSPNLVMSVDHNANDQGEVLIIFSTFGRQKMSLYFTPAQIEELVGKLKDEDMPCAA